jgi:hypothetical protein
VQRESRAAPGPSCRCATPATPARRTRPQTAAAAAGRR